MMFSVRMSSTILCILIFGLMDLRANGPSEQWAFGILLRSASAYIIAIIFILSPYS